MNPTRKFFVIWLVASLLWVGGFLTLTAPSWSKDVLAIVEFNYEITEEEFPVLKGRHGRVELYETQDHTEPKAIRDLILQLLGVFVPPVLGLSFGRRYLRKRQAS
ncbi:MAG: hypothetical protein ACPHIA_03920 [Alphaproteobacteria bacterium]